MGAIARQPASRPTAGELSRAIAETFVGADAATDEGPAAVTLDMTADDSTG